MTDKFPSYVHRVYGTGRVYDPELDAWREPVTENELRLMRLYDRELKRSIEILND